jgi:hypothetical protein
LKSYFITTICFLFCYTVAFCQSGITCSPYWNVKPSINQGFILEHRSTMAHLVKGYPTIYEINIGKPTCGHYLWHLENNKPDLGVSFSLIDFKNPAQLGYAFSLAPYAEIPLNQKEKNTRLVMRLCWGISYINKAFDIKTNSKNIAIGSNFNSFVQFKWFWQIKLNQYLRFEPGFAFSHVSNARARVPNLGLNVVSLNAGINYLIPQQKPHEQFIDSAHKVRSKNEMLIYSAFGYNQREVATGDLFCGLMSFEYHRNLRNTHKFGGGLDIFLDQNYIVDQIIAFNKSPEGIDNFRMAVKFVYAYNVGRISFPFEVGYYVFQKISPDGPVVSRVGVKYYSSSGIVASIGLRTHFAVAYDFEYGIGYRIFLKGNKKTKI